MLAPDLLSDEESTHSGPCDELVRLLKDHFHPKSSEVQVAEIQYKTVIWKLRWLQCLKFFLLCTKGSESFSLISIMNDSNLHLRNEAKKVLNKLEKRKFILKIIETTLLT